MRETTAQRILANLRAQISAEELNKCEAWLLRTFEGYIYKFQSDPETPRIVFFCYKITDLDRKLGKTKQPAGWRHRQHVIVRNVALFFHETILAEGFDKLSLSAQMEKLSEQSKRDNRKFETYFDTFPNWHIEEDWLKEENAVKV